MPLYGLVYLHFTKVDYSLKDKHLSVVGFCYDGDHDGMSYENSPP